MCDPTQTISRLSFSFLPSNVETQLPTPGVVERVNVGAAGECSRGLAHDGVPRLARAPGPAGPARTKAAGRGRRAQLRPGRGGGKTLAPGRV